MKKAMKKLMAALLAAALLCAMAVPALAASAGDDGTITIKKTVDGEKYYAYRIFDLESYTTGADAKYSYTVSQKWKDANFTTDAAFTEYFEVDAAGKYVKAKANLTTSTAADFAKKALKFAQDHSIAADADAVASGKEAHFNGLATGYYLINTTLGTLCMLDTTNPNVVIDEKNEVPDIEKIITDSTSLSKDISTAKIGTKVPYQVTIHAKKNAAGYVLTDTMTKGLTFNDDVEVTVNGTKLTEGTEYNVTAPVTDATTHNTTFEVEFKDSYLGSLTGDTDIVVTYSATVNEEAVIANESNDNTAQLQYGNGAKTTKKETHTYVYVFDLVKTNSNNELLGDAHFTLYDSADHAVELINIDDTTYRVAKQGETGTVTDIVSVTTGKIVIKGLDKATYTLKETKAPQGYNKLDDPITVDLTGGNLEANMNADGTYNDGGIHVINQAGTVLPGTGGIGTTIFYVVGGGLMIAAAVLLITKKRMENKN